MNVILNEKSITVAEGITLSELLQTLRIQSEKGTALAVNNEIVSRSRWSEHRVRENDRILCFTAIRGG